jgi:hypothetical protein
MSHIVENPDKVRRAEIVVGIPSYQEKDSIGFVTGVVDAGLEKYFGRKDCVIINVDNNSPDDTRGAFLKTETRIGCPSFTYPLRRVLKERAATSGICSRPGWNSGPKP